MRITPLALAGLPPLLMLAVLALWSRPAPKDVAGSELPLAEPAAVFVAEAEDTAVPGVQTAAEPDIAETSELAAPDGFANVPNGQSSRYRKLDEAFAADPVDSDWSPMMEATMRELLESVDIPRASMEIECRTRICRAVITHDVGVEAFQSPDGQMAPLDFSLFLRVLNKLPEQHFPRVQVVRGSTWPAGPGPFDGHLETRVYLTAAGVP